MARFRPKDYLTPSSPAETIQVLQQGGPRARIIAGGTTFYELAKRGMMPEVETIVDLSKLSLDYAKREGKVVVVGSMMSLTDLLKSGACNAPGCQAMEDFLAKFTPLQIRNLATVGGEFCSGIPFLDLPVVAMALGATLRVAGPSGSRDISTESFFLDYFLVDLKKGEYLLEVRIPEGEAGTASAFINFKRTATDLSLVGVAAKVTLDQHGKCKAVALGLGGMGQVPLRAQKIEEKLKGTELDPPAVEKATTAVEELQPTSSVHASPWYKKEVCRVLIRDAVEQARLRAARGI